jgi:hypothetical protein
VLCWHSQHQLHAATSIFIIPGLDNHITDQAFVVYCVQDKKKKQKHQGYQKEWAEPWLFSL